MVVMLGVIRVERALWFITVSPAATLCAVMYMHEQRGIERLVPHGFTPSASAAPAPLPEIFSRQCAIDSERSARTVGGSDDRELHIAYDVPRGEYAWHAGRLVLTAFDAAVLGELTP